MLNSVASMILMPRIVAFIRSIMPDVNEAVHKLMTLHIVAITMAVSVVVFMHEVNGTICALEILCLVANIHSILYGVKDTLCLSTVVCSVAHTFTLARSVKRTYNLGVIPHRLTYRGNMA